VKKEPYILYGRRPVQEFLKSAGARGSIRTVFLAESFPSSLRSQLASRIPAERFSILPKKAIDEQFPGINHQGVVICFDAPPQFESTLRDDYRTLFEEKDGLLIALDRIQDEHNLGSIIRSAEALGAKGVLVTGKGARPGPAVDRISTGASFHLKTAVVASLDHIIELAKGSGYWICASTSREDLEREGIGTENLFVTTDLSVLPPSDSLLLVIGHEGDGIKPLILRKADYLLQIPLAGKTASLNAGVAAGILIERLLNR